MFSQPSLDPKQEAPDNILWTTSKKPLEKSFLEIVVQLMRDSKGSDTNLKGSAYTELTTKVIAI